MGGRRWLLVVVASVIVTATACGDDSDGTASTALSTSVASTSSAPAAGSFPVTVEHALGSTTIPSAPQRVVALIDRDADTLLALGVAPVAIRSLYEFDTGVGPWAEDELGDATPIVWKGRELNFEAIAAARPDLIVYATSGGDEAEYDTLAGIAPTVGLPKGAIPWAATTEETTLLIAEALGRRPDGERMLADLDSYLADQAERHPVFAGKTANYLDIYPGGIASYPAEHIVNGVMYAVGFEPIPAAATIPAGDQSIEVSAERLSDYDADVVLIYPYGRTLAEIEAEIPTLATLDSATNGRMFILDDLAFSNSSVLSIPYALDSLLPQIDAALTTTG